MCRTENARSSVRKSQREPKCPGSQTNCHGLWLPGLIGSSPLSSRDCPAPKRNAIRGFGLFAQPRTPRLGSFPVTIVAHHLTLCRPYCRYSPCFSIPASGGCSRFAFLPASWGCPISPFPRSSSPVRGAPGSISYLGLGFALIHRFFTPRNQSKSFPFLPSYRTTNCSTASPSDVPPILEPLDSRACNSVSLSSSQLFGH